MEPVHIPSRQEIAFLRAMVRATVHRPERPIVAPDVDGASLWRSLNVHGSFLATAAPVLAEMTLPPAVEEGLAGYREWFETVTARIWTELGKVLPRLRAAGIEPIVLKGPVLAATVYPAVGHRVSQDIDLLVSPDALDVTSEVLADLGYRPARTVAPGEFYDRYHFHRIVRNDDGLCIELHWDLTPVVDFVRFDLRGLRARAHRVRLQEVDALVPAQSDILLHMASQSLDPADTFSDLRRVMDAALLIRAGAGADPELPGRAREQGSATALWVLLRLGEELAGVPAPPDLMAAIRPSGFVVACIESLDLPERALSRYVLRRAGLAHLVKWLCAPAGKPSLRVLRDFLLPGEAYYLERGAAPGELPGLPGFIGLTLERIGYLAKLVAYQLWRLVAHSRPARGT